MTPQEFKDNLKALFIGLAETEEQRAVPDETLAIAVEVADLFNAGDLATAWENLTEVLTSPVRVLAYLERIGQLYPSLPDRRRFLDQAASIAMRNGATEPEGRRAALSIMQSLDADGISVKEVTLTAVNPETGKEEPHQFH